MVIKKKYKVDTFVTISVLLLSLTLSEKIIPLRSSSLSVNSISSP